MIIIFYCFESIVTLTLLREETPSITYSYNYEILYLNVGIEALVTNMDFKRTIFEDFQEHISKRDVNRRR